MDEGTMEKKIAEGATCALQIELVEPKPHQVLCALNNNQLEVHTITMDSKDTPSRLDLSLDTPGHRQDIRTLALSSADEVLLTGSQNSVKLWNMTSGQCTATLPSGYTLCSAFVPGNKHAIVGTKQGDLELFDLSSSTLLETFEGAHAGSVWSMAVWPDKRGITTGGADKEVKFWEFALRETGEEGTASKRTLTLRHTRTLKLSDDVLCVRHSHDNKYLAVSLLDSTVKVFFTDTLKFYLSLYGHKLPVMSMDISSDGTLIATGSADKTVKIWGLDFGDCHRSLLAHEGAVMDVKFVFGTHFFMSAGKDGLVKYWDADKFEQIMKLSGHHGEVWGLAMGKYGNIVVSASHDRSIRIWRKTDEQFVLEEERERELEEMHDRAAVEDAERHTQAIGSGVEVDPSQPLNGIPVTTGAQETGDAGRSTVDTLKAGEKITAALDVWEEETEAFQLYHDEVAKYEKLSKEEKKANPAPKPPPRSPYVIASRCDGMVPEAYVLHVLEGIRGGDLEQALTVLPFAAVLKLLEVLQVWVDKGWNLTLTSRALFFIINTFHASLAATRACRPLLMRMRAKLGASLKANRDMIGVNLSGLRMLKKEWDANHSAEFTEALAAGPFGAPPATGGAPSGPTEPKDLKEGSKNSKKKGEKRKRVVVVS